MGLNDPTGPAEGGDELQVGSRHIKSKFWEIGRAKSQPPVASKTFGRDSCKTVREMGLGSPLILGPYSQSQLLKEWPPLPSNHKRVFLFRPLTLRPALPLPLSARSNHLDLLSPLPPLKSRSLSNDQPELPEVRQQGPASSELQLAIKPAAAFVLASHPDGLSCIAPAFFA